MREEVKYGIFTVFGLTICMVQLLFGLIIGFLFSFFGFVGLCAFMEKKKPLDQGEKGA